MNMNLPTNKLMNRFFRRVDNVVWDLMTGRIGVRHDDGIATVEGEGDTAQVTINLFDQFGVPLPAFAQNTPTSAISIGDLIYGAKAPLGWVIEKKEHSFVLLKVDGTRSTWSPPKVQMMGFDGGAMVLRNLINTLPGGTTGLGNMQSTLLPLLMMSDGDLDLDKMLPIMLMTQMGGAADGAAAANGGNMMQMMLMMQMFGNNKSGSSRNGGNWFDQK